MFRRQTIIALRARHQAFRIAADILYPDLYLTMLPPPPPRVQEKSCPAPIPAISHERLQEIVEQMDRRRRRIDLLWIAVTLLAAVGVIGLMFIVMMGPPNHL